MITTEQVLKQIKERENRERESLKREHEEMDRKWKEMGGRPYTDFPPFNVRKEMMILLIGKIRN